MDYLQAENLKHKRTLVRKLLLLAPLVPILLSVLSPLMFQMNSYNWWYVLLYPGVLTLICCLVEQRDHHKLSYRAVTPLPVSLGSVWGAKIGVAAIYSLAANLIFLMLNLLGAFVLLAVYNLPMTISVPAAVLGTVCIVLVNLWQIPLCMWLSNKCGIFLTLIINAGVGSILGIFTSISSLWMLCPYGWVPHLMITVLGIMPNGEPAATLSGGVYDAYGGQTKSLAEINTFAETNRFAQTSFPAILLTSAAALLLFAMLSFWTGKRFQKKEVR